MSDRKDADDPQLSQPEPELRPRTRRIRFWGYDNTIEVPFFIEESALIKLSAGTHRVEAAILAAFDSAWDRITVVARAFYAPRQRSLYVLAASDF